MRNKDRCDVNVFDEGRVRQASDSLISGLDATRLAEVFKALADPTRLRIVSSLSSGELCVCDISATVGMTQSAVSHQLRLLRNLGLVNNRKTGRMVFYTLASDHVRVIFEQGKDHLLGK
jgi:ArsR family transcriptional regulator, lead/cadmium/zinc/bismuth-responsive transcriptional repressor